MYKILLFTLLLNFQVIFADIVSTIYGDFDIQEPVLIELLNDPLMQRLKNVRQYGVDYYAFKKQEYNRYEHSVGVFILARKYGADLKEQIASLLHDVSHTAFSHLACFFLKKGDSKNSYQDDIHEEFLKNSSLEVVLNKYGFSIDDIYHKNSNFKILEAELPNICADRLEYNIFGGILDGFITHEDKELILNDLKYEDGIWYFTNTDIAKKFADITLNLTKTRWAHQGNSLRNIFGTKVIGRAIDINLITLDEFHKSTDELIWNKLISSDDQEIKNNLNKLLNAEKYFELNKDNFDQVLKHKHRGIDPFIKVNNNYIRLTTLSPEYKQAYSDLDSWLKEGLYIRYINN